MTGQEIHEAFKAWFGDEMAGAPSGQGKFQLPDMRGAIKDIAEKSFRAGALWAAKTEFEEFYIEAPAGGLTRKTDIPNPEQS